MTKVYAYSELAELIQTELGREEIISGINEIHGIVNSYVIDFLNDAEFSIEEYENIQRKLTGCIMYLHPVATYADTVKKHNEMERFSHLKENFIPQNDKDKFIATTAEKQASLSVSEYRAIRNLAQGILKSAEAGVYTCKDNVQNKKREINDSK